MTQVKEWSNQELNRKLAELMGYSIYHYNKDYEENCYYMLMDAEFDPAEPDDGRRKTEERAWNDAPDYCTDPAASLEVQAKAIEVDDPEYFTQLLALKGVLDNYSLFAALNSVALASPRERAEAAYITMQGALNSSKEE